MAVALEMARAALQLGDRSNLINERIAKRIIELAKTGELNPDLLCEFCVEGISPALVDGGHRNGIVERNAMLLRCSGIPPAPSHLSAITAPWKTL